MIHLRLDNIELMITEVFFDIETKKLFSDLETFDPAGLGVSIVSVLHRTISETQKVVSETVKSFWEKDLPDMWSLFDNADRIIGFNSKTFDIPVLAPFAPERFTKLPHFDILEQIKTVSGRRIGLDALCAQTLGSHKTDKGFNAVLYWNRGDSASLKKLREYCEMDVALTRDLYDFIRKNGYVTYLDKWNTTQKILLDFSYPKPPDANQMGLF